MMVKPFVPFRKKGRTYTTTPVAGSWAGVVMSSAGAVIIWAIGDAHSNTNFATLQMPKNAKAKCDRQTDRRTSIWTDRRTDRHGDLKITLPATKIPICPVLSLHVHSSCSTWLSVFFCQYGSSRDHDASPHPRFMCHTSLVTRC